MSDKPMTPAELDAAERLCQEATPGPFEAKPYKWYEEEWWRIENDRSDCIGAHMCKADAALFAAARDLLPRLLAEVKALTEKADTALKDYGAALTVLAERTQERDMLVSEIALIENDTVSNIQERYFGKGGPPMMTPDDAYKLLEPIIATAELYQEPTPMYPREAVRALLAGYEAARPRVLTLREVQCYQDCPSIWHESKLNSYWLDSNKVINMYAHPDSVFSKDYGVCWRCWSGKPTREQEKGTPWERGPEPGKE